MIQLTKKIMIFAIPVIAYCLVVGIIDPFNYFNVSGMISNDVKLKTSYPANYFLWKCAEFRNSPCENILLGDSRTEHIDAAKVTTLAGEKYYNFAYGGATPAEIIDTFWYAVKQTKLKKVYIGLNFDNYKKSNTMNRFPETDAIMKNPLLYIANISVLKSINYNLKSQYGATTVDLSTKPAMTVEQFWIDQLEYSRNSINDKHEYPGDFYAKLKKIKNFCERNQIQLFFIILPTHTDMQKRIASFKLTSQYNRFLYDLSSLGTTYDFDYPNDLTANRNNYNDPFHLKDSDAVIKDVWGQRPRFAKLLN